jgi:hypothetical protein
VLNNPARMVGNDETSSLAGNGGGVEDSKALSDDPVNKIMDRLGPIIVGLFILAGITLGLAEASGFHLIESILGPGFGLHGTGALVYVMSGFAYACFGGIAGMIVALAVNAVLSVIIAIGR